jgi:hypothetical protein
MATGAPSAKKNSKRKSTLYNGKEPVATIFQDGSTGCVHVTRCSRPPTLARRQFRMEF